MKTSKQLQEEGEEIAKSGMFVPVIYPYQEKMFVDEQLPFILSQQIPMSC